MTSIPRLTTTQAPNQGGRHRPASPNPPPDTKPEPPSAVESALEELRELPEELAGATTAVVKDVEATRAGRAAVSTYLWLMDHAPRSTRGRLTAAGVLFVIVLVPALAMLYVTLTAGSGATEEWFRRLGYPGIFLANLAGTATLFIPVPGLTAAAQALIVSSADILNPFWVGVVGGLGMALGEVTAYVAGMATALITTDEEIKIPGRLKRLVDVITRRINWLMAHYGMPTLFLLSVFPNPLFEVAGWTAGATRYSFWKFMAAVTPGKITRGIILAYVGEKLFFG